MPRSETVVTHGATNARTKLRRSSPSACRYHSRRGARECRRREVPRASVPYVISGRSADDVAVRGQCHDANVGHATLAQSTDSVKCQELTPSAIWSLPPDNSEYPWRWGWTKKEFTQRWLAIGGRDYVVSEGRKHQRRRGIWQPRYWEHTLENDDDFERHFDYIHWDPVKHGYVRCPREWPHSSFHRYVRLGGRLRSELEMFHCGHGAATIGYPRYRRQGRRDNVDPSAETADDPDSVKNRAPTPAKNRQEPV